MHNTQTDHAFTADELHYLQLLSKSFPTVAAANPEEPAAF